MKLIYLIFFLTFVSCKYNLSPYSADAPELKINDEVLKLIPDIEASSGDIVRVAIISDTHNYYREIKDQVASINKNGPYSFVIVTGDITNIALLDEYQEAHSQFSELKSPYMVVVGNHDLLANGEKIFHRIYGSEDFSFDFKGTRFVLFNNNNWESSRITPDLNWIQQELTRLPAVNRKVVISHCPLTDGSRFSSTLISDTINILDTQNVDYAINGHNHNSSVKSIGAATTQITIGSSFKRNYFELIIDSNLGSITHKKISF
jgi:3',5'-cyclic-AMP phosphodiesterase